MLTEKKKATGVEFFCQRLFSVGGQSWLEDIFQALLKPGSAKSHHAFLGLFTWTVE